MRVKLALLAVAVTTLTGMAAIPVSAGATPAAGPSVVRSGAAAVLPGGLRAVPAPGNKDTRGVKVTATITNYGATWLVNSKQDTFAVTVQPTTSDGRAENHLYMWVNNNWSTQRFDELYDSSNNTYIFKSLYNGSAGGIANGCINVPGGSTKSGTQLIVYNCDGYPTNERFQVSTQSGQFWVILRLYYKNSLAIDLGNNFPSDGVWVITYQYNSTNWEQQFLLAVAS